MVKKKQKLSEMVTTRTTLHWAPGDWPETVTVGLQTWTKDHQTVAADGEVQTVEYRGENGDWLIVAYG
jgi:hypothetical protein